MDDGTEHIDVALKMPDAVASAATASHSETQALEGFLGASSADNDKLSQIAQFVRGDTKEFTDIDLLQAVRSLETKLGTPRIGEKRIDILYNYVKLQSQIDEATKARDSLLRLH